MTVNIKRSLAAVVAIAFIALAVFVIVSTAPGANIVRPPVAGAQQYNVPQNERVTELELPLVQLEGNWQYKMKSIAFNATVEGQHIKVTMVTEDGSFSYWDGSFKTAESPGHTVTSVRTDEVALSQNPTKDFQIDDGAMKFEFQAMGVTKQIELTR